MNIRGVERGDSSRPARGIKRRQSKNKDKENDSRVVCRFVRKVCIGIASTSLGCATSQ